MTSQTLVQIMTILLVLVMVVLVFVAWHALGIAVEKRPWLSRLYSVLTLLLTVALLLGIGLVIWYTPVRQVLEDILPI